MGLLALKCSPPRGNVAVPFVAVDREIRGQDERAERARSGLQDVECGPEKGKTRECRGKEAGVRRILRPPRHRRKSRLRPERRGQHRAEIILLPRQDKLISENRTFPELPWGARSRPGDPRDPKGYQGLMSKIVQQKKDREIYKKYA